MTAPLVIYASNFSYDDIRARRWELRARAGRLIGGRQARCGFHPIAPIVAVKSNGKSAHFSGIETCGSIWTCAVCASRIAAERAVEVHKAISGVEAAGGATYMMAFTIRHNRKHTALESKSAVTGAWSKLIAGSVFARWKRKYGIDGYIRALEVTWNNQNGWHPHLHVLFTMTAPLDDDARAELEQLIFERWAHLIEKAKWGWVKRDLFMLERAENSDAAGSYVAKWGADKELTQSHVKVARGGGMSPWQLLERHKGGDRRAGALFCAYAKAFRGARQLTWSKGLKARFGIGDVIDADVAAETSNEAAMETIGALTRQEYYDLHKAGLLPVLLSNIEDAEDGGAVGFKRFIGRWRTDHPPGPSADPWESDLVRQAAVRAYADGRYKDWKQERTRMREMGVLDLGD
jgi:hypothetical protein